ncbi:hypothetical protein F511_17800 [Dorcoceras hygrometricum]|uniref:WRKY19-like zinc finger domain-containing protein n=1 Tax=Dorcoceras hygrometricum TaxID=472368 RepID=A0A2Z7B2A4_9LAMI|nr:hypothetical protein F511_17800 [Dorcoceras hygrometricum]
MYSAFCGDFATNGKVGDTTLRLDGIGYNVHETATFGGIQSKSGGRGNCTNAPDDGCKLVLGLGPTPSAYSNEYSPSMHNKAKEIANIFNQELSNQRDSILKLGLSGGTDVVSDILEFSASTRSHFDSTCLPDQVSNGGCRLAAAVDDEGSTSAKKSGGYMRRLILAPRMETCDVLVSPTNKFLDISVKSNMQLSQPSSEHSAISNYTMSAVSEPGSATISSDRRGSNTKRCKFSGCAKGSRGATGLCIGHGGGQRCQKPGCNKGAESRTAYCKAHGGGNRCQHLGCTKSAEGKTDHCIAHGGGRRCGFSGGCNKAARGKSGLCIKHGGGKRCKVEGCPRSAEGQIGLCISHGGGRRCAFVACNKGAQGSTLFCKAHGGGKRCIFAGCTKGAEGSTPLCKGHGGGKRCLFDGGGKCTKSARGKTDCCVKHGGGKRCKFDNCDKSAQGSTDFCKAHGGGKRCNWEEGKCEKFARGKSGLCAAHSSLVLGRDSSKGGMIGPGLFRGLVPSSSTARSSFENTCSSSGVSMLSDSIDSLERPQKRPELIPPQVLVPLSMKTMPYYPGPSGSEKRMDEEARKSLDFVVPEGRVHGGGLLSLLGGNLNKAVDGI